MLIIRKNVVEVYKVKKLLSKEFEMKDLGVASKILGLETKKNSTRVRERDLLKGIRCIIKR